jgi:hypothetical protein
MILFPFNVALGSLEVAAYEFVRETEERLVLVYGVSQSYRSVHL